MLLNKFSKLFHILYLTAWLFVAFIIATDNLYLTETDFG
jgi:hypothetical protein